MKGETRQVRNPVTIDIPTSEAELEGLLLPALPVFLNRKTSRAPAAVPAIAEKATFDDRDVAVASYFQALAQRFGPDPGAAKQGDRAVAIASGQRLQLFVEIEVVHGQEFRTLRNACADSFLCFTNIDKQAFAIADFSDGGGDGFCGQRRNRYDAGGSSEEANETSAGHNGHRLVPLNDQSG
jgi:hypothetical protein